MISPVHKKDQSNKYKMTSQINTNKLLVQTIKKISPIHKKDQSQ